MYEHEASAANAGVVRIHHAKRETDRNRGVNRVTTRLENIESGLGCERMNRSDHAASGE
jgi:hypothetical protein